MAELKKTKKITRVRMDTHSAAWKPGASFPVRHHDGAASLVVEFLFVAVMHCSRGMGIGESRCRMRIVLVSFLFALALDRPVKCNAHDWMPLQLLHISEHFCRVITQLMELLD